MRLRMALDMAVLLQNGFGFRRRLYLGQRQFAMSVVLHGARRFTHTPPSTPLIAFRNAVKTGRLSLQGRPPDTPERVSKRDENRADASTACRRACPGYR